MRVTGRRKTRSATARHSAALTSHVPPDSLLRPAVTRRCSPPPAARGNISSSSADWDGERMHRRAVPSTRRVVHLQVKLVAAMIEEDVATAKPTPPNIFRDLTGPRSASWSSTKRSNDEERSERVFFSSAPELPKKPDLYPNGADPAGRGDEARLLPLVLRRCSELKVDADGNCRVTSNVAQAPKETGPSASIASAPADRRRRLMEPGAYRWRMWPSRRLRAHITARGSTPASAGRSGADERKCPPVTGNWPMTQTRGGGKIDREIELARVRQLDVNPSREAPRLRRQSSRPAPCSRRQTTLPA